MYKRKFFTEEEFNIMEAFAARIIPSGDNPQEDPGAREVGSTEFIDFFVAQRDKRAQEFIRQSLKKLNGSAEKNFNAKFTNLSEEQQDELLQVIFKKQPAAAEFRQLRKMALYAFHSNYVKEGYEGKKPWELTGYLGPVTYGHMTTEMINRHYQNTQDDKTFVL